MNIKKFLDRYPIIGYIGLPLKDCITQTLLGVFFTIMVIIFIAILVLISLTMIFTTGWISDQIFPRFIEYIPFNNSKNMGYYEYICAEGSLVIACISIIMIVIFLIGGCYTWVKHIRSDYLKYKEHHDSMAKIV